MKKLFCELLIIFTLCSLAACGSRMKRIAIVRQKIQHRIHLRQFKMQITSMSI